MRRWLFVGILIAPVTFAGTSQSNAAQCFDSLQTFLENFGNCVSGKPPQGSGMPLDNNLLSIRHSTAQSMNKDDLYAVTITCTLPKSQAKYTDWNPFVTKNLVTSHIVALTNTRLAQPDLPANARASITVFSVAGDNTNRKVFLNTKCKTQFLISGRESVFLAATANQTTTDQPGPLTRVIYEAIQVAIPILPLVKGTALASTILGDVTKTQDPLTKMFAELNNGRTYTKPDDLYIGNNLIRTPYSEVNVQVSKVKSVLDAGNRDFLKIFEDATDAAEPQLALSTSAAPGQKCGEFANGLRGRNFSPPDIAYSLVLVSQAANLTKTNTLECMGQRYALAALADNEAPAWARYNGKVYTSADAKSYFADQGGAIVVQPKFDKWRGKLQLATEYLGAYLQSPAAQAARVSNYFSDPVHLENLTTLYSGDLGDTDSKLGDVLTNLVNQKFQRAGCLASDTEALASVLLFRSDAKNQTKFSSSDSIVMRVWYNEGQSIYRVKFEYDVGLVEKALNLRGSRICGENLEVLAAPRAPQVAQGTSTAATRN